MTKVLEKALDILELLGANPDKEHSVSDVGAAIRLSKATAGRLLADLLSRGYAYQPSNRGGYSLGPMAYGLAAKGLFRKDLVDASKDLARRLAHEELHESVIVASLHMGRRYILVNENGNREVQPVIDKPWYDDFYFTATGRLLLAYASESEISGYISKHPMPKELWDGIEDEETLRRKLSEIRSMGMVSCRSTTTCFWVLAFPLRHGGRVDSALGITVLADSFKAPRSEFLLSRGAECARQIESKLSKSMEASRK